MAKANFKTLLVEKGEKYALIGAGALMLLFMIVGVMDIAASPNPDEFIAQVDQTTNKVTSAISAPADEKSVAALPAEAIDPYVPKRHTSNWKYQLYFDPIAPPDTRRINPTVLAPVEVTADYTSAKILAYDIQDEGNGKPKIGVIRILTKKGVKEPDKNDLSKLVQDLNRRFRFTDPKKNQPKKDNPPMNREGMGENMPPPVVDRGEMPPEGGGQRVGIEYVTLDPEKMQSNRFAYTIYPERMVIVQAAFPLKAQLEEIQKALRLQSLSEVVDAYKDINKDEDIPKFYGLVIQRQVLHSDGKTVETPWKDLDIQANYQPIHRLKVQTKPDDPGLNYVKLPVSHNFWLPLPHIITGTYPELKINALQETIKKMIAANKPPPAPKKAGQFDGGSIFDVDDGAGSAGTFGQPMGGEGIQLPKPIGREGEGNTNMNMGMAASTILDMDYALIRMIDNDNIIPDRLYQYRIKVRMQNPNWVGEKDKKNVPAFKQKYDLVSRPSDADVEMIEGPWAEMKGTVSVPKEDFLFGTDPVVDPKNRNVPIFQKSGQGMLQIQRWMKTASVGNYSEPIGDWIVADIVATRGTYLGGRQFVNLPIWSSEHNRFILREVAPEKGKNTPRKGVIMDPTRPGPEYSVVEVEGGLRDDRPLTRTSRVTEETAAEVLLMDAAGRLQVRSSFADRTDADRAKREGAWRTWIEATERNTQGLVPGVDPNKKKDFD